MEDTDFIKDDAADSTFDAANPLGAEIEKLKAELTTAKDEAAKNKDGWLRTTADFSNFKKRQEGEASNLRSFATMGLVSKLLPVVDDFDRAAKTLPESLKGMTWIEGLLLVQRKLQLVMESEKVLTINAIKNDVFDPNLHEAVSHDDADGVESGHIVEELQKGYKMGERVIRPALVRVAR